MTEPEHDPADPVSDDDAHRVRPSLCQLGGVFVVAGMSGIPRRPSPLFLLTAGLLGGATGSLASALIFMVGRNALAVLALAALTMLAALGTFVGALRRP
jgi:hypothetical protein